VQRAQKGERVSDETDQEVAAAVEAIKALFPRTEDAADRFKRLTALLNGWPDVHRQVRAMRQETGAQLYSGGKGLTYDEIGKLINVTESRARHIVLGITNPSREKRKREEREREAGEAG
jgi:DNA-directed RNA polymerase sigma subunit (sigma70/sigma32)